MKTWTVEEMLGERPCCKYTEERLLELWAGRERLTLLEMLELDIPDADKVWVCCMDHPHRAAWITRVVARAVENHALRGRRRRGRRSGQSKSKTCAPCCASTERPWRVS